jgi:hypothetical protein
MQFRLVGRAAGIRGAVADRRSGGAIWEEDYGEDNGDDMRLGW